MADDRREQAVAVVAERLTIDLAKWALKAGALADLAPGAPIPNRAWQAAAHQVREQVHEDLHSTEPGYQAACEYLRRAEAAS